MNSEFRNAYHFIPRKERQGADFPADFPQAAGFGKTPETAAQGHACYAQNTRSGILHATITLEQATVIGGQRVTSDTSYSVIEPFLFGGQPAIPATSIKGLISSIAEVASMANYRIVDTRAKLTTKYYDNAAKESKRSSRDTLTLIPPKLQPGSAMSEVDALFGFVRPVKADDKRLQALAGKLRFSLGLPKGEVTYTAPDDDFPGVEFEGKQQGKGYHRLKEASQPMKEWADPTSSEKFRSSTPNFYFREKQGASSQPISKKAFATNSKNYEIQGQKAYLHAQSTTADPQPWKSRATLEEDLDTSNGNPAAGRKSVVKLLAPGTQFAFTIRFDNLTEAEFQLLCFALRPSEKFRHKIGMGKALGLGSVRIDVTGVGSIDRLDRYKPENIFANTNLVDEMPQVATAANAREEWLRENDPAALNALLLIGETHDFPGGNAHDKPVLWVPLTEAKYRRHVQGDNAEGESYEWFSENDKKKADAQRLRPITESDTAIPTLWTGAPQPAAPVARTYRPPRTAPVMFDRVRLTGVIEALKKADQAHRFIIADEGRGRFYISAQKVQDAGGLNAEDRVSFEKGHEEAGKAPPAINVRKL
jgi:CRISPR/Cas system CSM-associated protein Csm3 (group 7 of RAMP superfamily)